MSAAAADRGTTASTTSAAFFEQKYADDPTQDPWGFATDADELRRYRQLLDTLPREHYASAFEPGCSIGVLTAELATRCDHVLAVDLSATAIAAAARRCESVTDATVELRVASLRDGLRPGDGPFDLIVLSEIGYYFTAEELADLVRSLVDRLVRGGDLVAAHWTGVSADHVLGGEHVHDVIQAALGWTPLGPRLHTGGPDGPSTTPPVLAAGRAGAVVDRWRRS
jgi:SAM-dependent methyltransferase